MEKAWAFYRRSTDKQELSIDDQRRECRAYAMARGWTIIREFVPANGFASGLSIERDSAFQEMIRLAELRSHDVRFLVVYDVSRFGRLVTDEKIYWEQRFKKHGGIQIVYVHGDFKNDGSLSDTLLKVVKHAEAHEYSMKLSEVTLRGAKSHSALGHSAGGVAPFGYNRMEIDATGQPVRVMKNSSDWKSNKLHRVVWTPSSIDAPVVRWVFETYDKGTGLNLLVHGLNERKIAAPRGRYWSKTMVRYMIRNRAYLGERIYNRRSYKAYRRGERAQLENPTEAWIVKRAAHEPIVDSDLFERVQARLKTRAVSIGRTAQRPYLLTGIARCARCGYRMIGQPLTGNGHRYLMYTCSGYLRIGRMACRSVHILAETLETSVLQSIRAHLTVPSWREEMRTALRAMVKAEFGEQVKGRVEEIEQQLAGVDRQIANIVDAIRVGGGFSIAVRQALANLERQRESIAVSLGEAQERANKRIGADVLAEKIAEYFADFDRLWREGLMIEEKKELLRCYVHQIDIHHSPTDLKAEIWLYKVPIPTTQMTPALNGLEPLITRVNCGGRNVTLVKNLAENVKPYLAARVIALKRPRAHYRRQAA
jgi:DNA invertase Pin-like site-specific DNA recombinase